MREWKISPVNDWDKDIQITGPLTLYVDFDDVDHKAVETMVRVLVSYLNNFAPLNQALHMAEEGMIVE